jgi:hypothetical protein
MPRSFLFVLFFLLSANANATNLIALKITDFGIEGTYRQGEHFGRLQIEAENESTQAQSFTLKVYEAITDANALPASPVYLLPLTLQAREKRMIDVPLRIPNGRNNSVLYAEADNEDGAPIGMAARRFWQPAYGWVVGLFCGGEEICKAIRQTILFSGTPEEQTRKAQNLHLIQLRELPSVWWAYTALNDVVIAGPLTGTTKEQSDALEAFTLRGGKLVLVEKEMGGTSTKVGPFATSLASPTNGEPKPAGKGTLVRISSINSPDFSAYFRQYGFATSTPAELQELFARYRMYSMKYPGSSFAVWLHSRTATHFRFPGTLELVLWMTGYLLLMIAVNFLLLRKIGKPEYAWITIPLLSLVFSVALYLVSARNRPTEYGLDELRYYEFDGDNALAIAQEHLQISAPHEGLVKFSVPREFVYNQAQEYQADVVEINPEPRTGILTEIKLGETWESADFLRMWSSDSLSFEFIHRFPGSVVHESGNRLRNSTGVDFDDAMLVTGETAYFLGHVAAGEIVDLHAAKKVPYQEMAGHSLEGFDGSLDPPFATGEMKDSSLEEHHPNGLWKHSGTASLLEEAICSWPIEQDKVFKQTKAVFLGHGKDVMPAGSLTGVSARRRSDAFYVVTYRDWK